MSDTEILDEQLDRPRSAQPDAEGSSPALVHALTREIRLLREVAFAANEALSIDDALGATVSLVCTYGEWPLGHALVLGESGSLSSTGIWCDMSDRRFERFRQRT